MKNKLGITAAAILAAVSLAACSNGNNQSSSQSSKTSSSKIVKKNTNKQSAQSSEKEQSSSSSNSSSSSSSQKASSQAPEHDRMGYFTGKLRKALPGMLLPTKDGLGTGSDKLNVRYTSSGDTNTVYYSVGDTAKDFNSDSVKNERPYAVLKEVKNASNAEDIINYSPEQKGLPTKKLDDNTTGTIQGAAGQRYLQWNKDKWSFVIQANSMMKKDPTDRGKEVLALVNQYGVPSTSTHGNLHVTLGDHMGSLNTVIAWQDGKNVYELKAHDTETALKMLNSLK
ncbi:hypothetical protein GCM10022297_16350 [Lactobacillus hamsteri]|uniref:Lipoprotein n=1 Tax=Lactobacillus hamsteri DSM 5661 = JCM 6256 TaxID=1423754 RepID=A0A0R1YDC4_9LACO|nr:hypothetical protein [Lactobacillus hamsteri]KRM37478.1 hypothetical protein FC39_GL000127 [Lactobacillus hamsteri DSM 5661 = JCM 6256]